MTPFQDQDHDQDRQMPVSRRLETKTKARGQQQHCFGQTLIAIISHELDVKVDIYFIVM